MRLNCVHFWLLQKMDAEVGVIGSVSVRYTLVFKVMELKTIFSLINTIELSHEDDVFATGE